MRQALRRKCMSEGRCVLGKWPVLSITRQRNIQGHNSTSKKQVMRQVRQRLHTETARSVEFGDFPKVVASSGHKQKHICCCSIPRTIECEPNLPVPEPKVNTTLDESNEIINHRHPATRLLLIFSTCFWVYFSLSFQTAGTDRLRRRLTDRPHPTQHSALSPIRGATDIT